MNNFQAFPLLDTETCLGPFPTPPRDPRGYATLERPPPPPVRINWGASPRDSTPTAAPKRNTKTKRKRTDDFLNPPRQAPVRVSEREKRMKHRRMMAGK